MEACSGDELMNDQPQPSFAYLFILSYTCCKQPSCQTDKDEKNFEYSCCKDMDKQAILVTVDENGSGVKI